MNCAKCSKPHRKTGDPVKDYAPQIRLIKIGTLADHDKFKCPRCLAVFFFERHQSQTA